MNRHIRATLFTVSFVLLFTAAAHGQWCNPALLRKSDDFEKDYRVIDARPTEVNKVKGKNSFRKVAKVAIINMNPFMYKYDLKVDQTAVEDNAALDFIKLLGAPITDLASIASFRAVANSQDAATLEAGGDLERLITRTGGPPASLAAVPPYVPPPAPASDCSVAMSPIAQQALNFLAGTRDQMLRQRIVVDGIIAGLAGQYVAPRAAYLSQQDVLYNASSDGPQICTAANTLMTSFAPAPGGPTSYPDRRAVNSLKREIANLDSLINELKTSATDFKSDADFSKCQARTYGFNYADSLIKLADAMLAYRQALDKRAQAMSDETKAYDFLVKTIKTFAAPGAAGALAAGPGMKLLENTFEVVSLYDISALDIQLVPSDLQPPKPFKDPDDIDSFRARVRAERTGATRGDFVQVSQRDVNGTPVVVVGDTDDGVGAASARAENVRQRQQSPPRAQIVADGFTFADSGSGGGGNGGGGDGGSGSNSAGVRDRGTTIGARRFELSGGLVYSTLDRREYKGVLGFARNAQGEIVDDDGKPTDKRELSSIVGLSESAKSRFSPLVMLHTRLTENPKYNLFFSVGVTAKNDSAGTNVEYLLGPSFNFLNKNAFFTFGAYAGKQQKLAGDLFVGAKLPSGTTDPPVRKEYQWAPAFSFTYRIPVKGGTTGH